MNKIDCLLMEKLEKLDVELDLLIRYIDDVRIMMRRILNGYKVVDDTLVMDEVLRQEDEAADDDGEKATMRVIMSVMNGLVEGIKFTSETRKDFPNEWGLPTLDTV